MRLDQLVIQQGRQLAAKSTTKEDLVSMIRYGADSIFQNTESTMAMDDLDEILARSEQKASKLNQKYKDMGFDDLQQFTTDQAGGFNAYKWEGQDFQQKNKQGFNWIGPSKRERKSNYDSLNFSRGGAGSNFPGIARREKAPKPKGSTTYDYQFFPPRLNDLLEKEKYLFWKENSVILTINDCPVENFEEWLIEEQKKIDNGFFKLI